MWLYDDEFDEEEDEWEEEVDKISKIRGKGKMKDDNFDEDVEEFKVI